MHSAPRVRLGNSQLWVSPVGFGCWPISGVSSLDVNRSDSIATIHAAIDNGINFIDTAFSYGYEGEADELLAGVLKDRRAEVILASKVGMHYDEGRQRIIDGRPQTILEHVSIVLSRLGVDALDIIYLHTPDPNTTIEQSAAAIGEVLQRGWARYAGVSNVDALQLEKFHSVCPVTVVQPPFNMLQQEAVRELRTFCSEHYIAIVCYWVLMKGLLAGRMLRDHRFHPRDRRLSYAVYQGQAWQRAHELLDRLRAKAAELECTVAQLVIAWTLAQDGIGAALCGAKRPEQIQETAQAMHLRLNASDVAEIDRWINYEGRSG